MFLTTTIKNQSNNVVQLGPCTFYVSRAIAVTDILPDIACLFSLFQKEAKSVAMILHVMNTVKSLVGFLNQGQTAVIACDQPLYAKEIQWHRPQMHGDKQFVVVLGGLHTEMAAWIALGDLQKG